MLRRQLRVLRCRAPSNLTGNGFGIWKRAKFEFGPFPNSKAVPPQIRNPPLLIRSKAKKLFAWASKSGLHGAGMMPADDDRGARRIPAANYHGAGRTPAEDDRSTVKMPAENARGVGRMPTEDDRGAGRMPAERDRGAGRMSAEDNRGTSRMTAEDGRGTGSMPAENDGGSGMVHAENDRGAVGMPGGMPAEDDQGFCLGNTLRKCKNS